MTAVRIGLDRRGFHGQDPQHRLPQCGDAVRVGDPGRRDRRRHGLRLRHWPIVLHAIGVGVDRCRPGRRSPRRTTSMSSTSARPTTTTSTSLSMRSHAASTCCARSRWRSTATAAYLLCEAARDSDRVTQVGFVYRQWPAVAMARKLIDEGAIGQIRTARSQFLLDYNGNPDVPMSWRFDKVRAGSGALGDVGSHCIDLLQYLAGPISQVAARMQTFVPQRRDRRGQHGRRHRRRSDRDPRRLRERRERHDPRLVGRHRPQVRPRLRGDRFARVDLVHAGSVPTNCSSSTAPTRKTVRAFAPCLVGPAHPGADGIHTVAAQGLGYTDAFTIAARNTLRNLVGRQGAVGPDVRRRPARRRGDRCRDRCGCEWIDRGRDRRTV